MAEKFRYRAELLADINAAVSEIETMPIERKDKKTGKIITKQYPVVSERVRAFRKIWPLGKIVTEIVEDTGNRATFRATVYDDYGIELATGHAFEDRDASLINKSSYLENCETSAVGRALAFLGIGISAGIASADEVNAAEIKLDAIKKAELEQQLLSPLEAAAFKTELENQGIDPDKVLRYFNIPNFEQLSLRRYRDILDRMAKAREIWGKDENK